MNSIAVVIDASLKEIKNGVNSISLTILTIKVPPLDVIFSMNSIHHLGPFSPSLRRVLLRFSYFRIVVGE